MHNSFKFLETNSKAMEIVSTTATVKCTPLKPRTDEFAQPCCVISGSSRSKQDLYRHFLASRMIDLGLKSIRWTPAR
jgi:hypothetical protein